MIEFSTNQKTNKRDKTEKNRGRNVGLNVDSYKPPKSWSLQEIHLFEDKIGCYVIRHCSPHGTTAKTSCCEFRAVDLQNGWRGLTVASSQWGVFDESNDGSLRFPGYAEFGLESRIRVLGRITRALGVHHPGFLLNFNDLVRNLLGGTSVAYIDSSIHLLLHFLRLGQRYSLGPFRALRWHPSLSRL